MLAIFLRRLRQPDAGEPVDALALEAQLREREDQRLLELAAVALDVLAVPLQVEDRVADELPGPVEGGLAAAVGLDDLDLRALRDVQLAFLGAPPGRDRRRVLEQQDRVRDRSLRDRACERALQLPRLGVRDDAEVHHVRALHGDGAASPGRPPGPPRRTSTSWTAPPRLSPSCVGRWSHRIPAVRRRPQIISASCSVETFVRTSSSRFRPSSRASRAGRAGSGRRGRRRRGGGRT